MELNDKSTIKESVKKINECNEVITFFKMNDALYGRDFNNEVIEAFEKDKKIEIARIRAIYRIKELRKKMNQEEE